MKVTRGFTIALALAMPSTVLAQGAQDRPPDEQTRRPPRDEPRSMDEGPQRSSTDIPKEQAMRVKSNVIGAVAGIEAADKAAAALYELAGTEQLARKDAQKTVQLARQGIEMALTRAQALDGMNDLSTDARSEATSATNKLKAARTTLQRMEKQVNTRMTRNDMEQLREHAQDLHTSLSNAENSVERIAKAYDVSTDLELGG